MKRTSIFLGAVLVVATGCGDDTSATGTGALEAPGQAAGEPEVRPPSSSRSAPSITISIFR